MKAILLKSYGNWEGLYIDGKLVDQGHEVGDWSPPEYWIEKAFIYKLTPDNFKMSWVTGIDDRDLMDSGSFPNNLSDLKGDYNG